MLGRTWSRLSTADRIQNRFPLFSLSPHICPHVPQQWWDDRLAPYPLLGGSLYLESASIGSYLIGVMLVTFCYLIWQWKAYHVHKKVRIGLLGSMWWLGRYGLKGIEGFFMTTRSVLTINGTMCSVAYCWVENFLLMTFCFGLLFFSLMKTVYIIFFFFSIKEAYIINGKKGKKGD